MAQSNRDRIAQGIKVLTDTINNARGSLSDLQITAQLNQRERDNTQR